MLSGLCTGDLSVHKVAVADNTDLKRLKNFKQNCFAVRFEVSMKINAFYAYFYNTWSCRQSSVKFLQIKNKI